MTKTTSAPEFIPEPINTNPQNAVLYSLLKQLAVSQWWSAAQIEQGQLQQLRRLLQFAAEHSPFYRERLRGFDTSKIDLRSFSELPLLTRSQLQKANSAIDNQQLPPDHGETKETMTSGSTGSPVRIRGTGVTALIWQAINLREHLWQQRDTSKIACAVRWRGDQIGMSAAGVALPDWGSPINQFFHTAPSNYLNSAVDIEKQAQWLRQIQPTYLMSHPSNVAALAEAFRHGDNALSELREIRTVGESVSEGMRELVRTVFGVPVTDFYSSQELGYIALQCPGHEHYHVQSESVIVEVLREDGSACAPYETGRLIVTSLRNYATPLVRYEIGDYGALGEPCSCGRGLPVLHSVNGRVRNMLRLPDGGKRWPNFGFSKLMEIAELRQFQVVQTQLDAIELKLVVGAPLSAEQEARLRKVLATSLGYPFVITITYHTVLGRSAGGKFEDFVSLLSQPA